MLSAETVRNSLRYLYRGEIHEEGYEEQAVEDLLRTLDFDALAVEFGKCLQHVPAYTILRHGEMEREFCGRDLFDKQAVRIYEDTFHFVLEHAADSGSALAHAHEIWLLEDGNLRTVSRVTVSQDRRSLVTEYREICGYPWGCPLELKLSRLTEELRMWRETGQPVSLE